MSSSYLETVQDGNFPHFNRDSDALIREQTDPAGWCLEQREFADWFAATALKDRLPPHTGIEGLGHYLEFIHKIQIQEEPLDFRYAIYGRQIAAAANMQYRGKSVSDLPEPNRSVFMDHYRDLMEHPRLFIGQLLFSEDVTRHPVWYRAVAPIGTQDKVTGFYVLTLPTEKLHE